MGKVMFQNFELLSLYSFFNRILNVQNDDIFLDVLTCYKLEKINQTINEKLIPYNNIREGLFYRYGEKLENGTIKIKPENIQLFGEEINKVLMESVELEIDKIKMSDLINNNVKIKPSEFKVLNRIFENDIIVDVKPTSNDVISTSETKEKSEENMEEKPLENNDVDKQIKTQGENE